MAWAPVYHVEEKVRRYYERFYRVAHSYMILPRTPIALLVRTGHSKILPGS